MVLISEVLGNNVNAPRYLKKWYKKKKVNKKARHVTEPENSLVCFWDKRPNQQEEIIIPIKNARKFNFERLASPLMFVK